MWGCGLGGTNGLRVEAPRLLTLPRSRRRKKELARSVSPNDITKNIQEPGILGISGTRGILVFGTTGYTYYIGNWIPWPGY